MTEQRKYKLTDTLVVLFSEGLTPYSIFLITVGSHGVEPVGILVVGPSHELVFFARHIAKV